MTAVATAKVTHFPTLVGSWGALSGSAAATVTRFAEAHGEWGALVATAIASATAVVASSITLIELDDSSVSVLDGEGDATALNAESSSSDSVETVPVLSGRFT
jgi:hypothetical protein